MDRASSEHDRVLKLLDPEAFAPAGDRADPPSWTGPSGTPPGKAGSLAEILENIRTCRWRCFRPRPLPARDGGDEDGGSERKTGGAPSDRLPDASGAAPKAPKNLSPGITEEQYHTHQQQLAQMQKQQLAQLRQKPPSQNASLPARLNAQVPGPSARAAKTLDSASAHFAASAVISASVPGVAEAGRDPRNHGASVNGVGQTSGTSRPPHSTSSTMPPSVPVQLLRTGSAPGGSTAQLPALGPNTPQSLPGGAHLKNVGAVSPVNLPLVGRASAPSPSALKLATVAATALERPPRVTPASGIGGMARENHERERLALNGISDTTVAMEVT